MGYLGCEMGFSHRHFLKHKTDWGFYLAGPLSMNWHCYGYCYHQY